MSGDTERRTGSWREHANCLDADPGLFVGVEHGVSGERFRIEVAKRRCAECPVWVQCFNYAVDMGQEAYGIWGGELWHEGKVGRHHPTRIEEAA